MVKGPSRFNVSQAALYLEVDRQTVLRWRRRGLLAERATWTAAELDQAAEKKPPKTQPKKKTPTSSGSSAPSPGSTPNPSDAPPAEQAQDADASGKASVVDPSGPSSSSSPERDPLELSLPMPSSPSKGGDAGRTLPAGGDANPAPNAPASPPAPASPDAPTFFGSMRNRT